MDEANPGKCVESTCTADLFKNCQYCSSVTNAQGATTNKCKICLPGFSLIREGADDVKGKCAKCVKNCLFCKDRTSCELCEPGTFFKT